MKIYNDSIENAVGVNSTSFGEYIGSAYSTFIPPLNGLMVQGNVGIGTTAPTQSLHVQGTFRLTGGLYDNSNSLGSANQVLSSTGTGIAWTTLSSAGGSISGSGTTNTLAKFNSPSSVTNSNISDNGSLITLGVAASANAQISINVPLGGTSIINIVNGSGLILQGRGTVGDPAALRIVGNDATVYNDALDTAYFQADYKNTRNLVLLSGTYGNDVPLNRLLMNSRQTTIWDGSHTTAPVPSGIFEVASGLAGTRANFRIIGTANQTADFFQVFSSATSSTVFIISAAGRVGIGTTSPTQSLHIQNNMRLTGSFFDSNNNSGTNNQMLMSTGAGVTWVNSFTGNISTSQVAFASGPNSLTGVSTFVLTSTGLGVNTSVPLSNLHVRGGIANSAVLRVDGTSGLLFQITDSLTGTLFSVNNISGISNFFVTDGVASPLFNLKAPVGLASELMSAVSPSNLPYFSIASSGNVGIATSSPTQPLHVQGNARITGGIFDSNNNIGSNRQLLSSTGTGISWTSIVATGIITGSGTNNTLVKFSGSSSITNSNVTDTGTQIVLGSASSVSGILTSFGYFGPGTNLTNLNASNLASGTVPSAVVSGSYSGIISVGTLTQLNVSGVTTSNGFFGPGTNLTNLNASNLASGTVPSAVVSGSYSGITSVGNLTQLNVTGFTTSVNLRLSGGLYDANNAIGSLGQLLSSTGSGIAWTSTNASGITTATGTGTVNNVPKYNSAFSFTTSNITDNGVAVTVTSRLNVVGIGSFTNDLIVNNMTVGLGSGQVAGNVAIGVNALASNPSSSSSTVAIGDRALQLATGSFFGVVAIGSQALQNNQGSRNFGLGSQALRSNTTGASNVAIGHLAMDANTTGSSNVAIGRGALQTTVSVNSNTVIGDSAMNLSTSDENTIIGALAGNSVTSGRAHVAMGVSAIRYVTTASLLTAIGYQALQGSATTTLNSGTQNTALGYQAGIAVTSGSNNLFAGFQAGLSNTSGSRNVFLGRASGSLITTGSDNTFVGDATNGVPGGSYQIGIGVSAIPTGSNLGAWGGATNATRTDLGVGTFTPLARMHVETLAAANQGLYIAGAASQTANLLKIDATTNGTQLFAISGIGSVGINTSVTSRYLWVQGDSRLNGNVGVNGDPISGYPLAVNGNIWLPQGSFLSWSAGNADISSGGSGAFDLRFRTYDGSTAARENMRIMSNGSVGIGTTSPAARLHVQGLAATTIPLILSGFGTPTVDLFRIESSIGGTRYITVDSTGELGIGTSSPTQSLHVQLGSRFSGQIFDVNNVPGSNIGIVSQALFSTGTGVTWAPIKRNLVVPLMTAFNPTQVGIDSGIFIVPQDPINGTSSMTFNFRRVNVRVETPSAAGITTINIAKSIGTGVFAGTSILSSNINLTGASTYEGFSTSFAVGFTTASSGDKLAINFVGVNTFHQNLTVELIAIEA